MKRVLGGEKPGAKASSSGEKERRSRDSSADKRKRRDKEVNHRSSFLRKRGKSGSESEKHRRKNSVSLWLSFCVSRP